MVYLAERGLVYLTDGVIKVVLLCAKHHEYMSSDRRR